MRNSMLDRILIQRRRPWKCVIIILDNVVELGLDLDSTMVPLFDVLDDLNSME